MVERELIFDYRKLLRAKFDPREFKKISRDFSKFIEAFLPEFLTLDPLIKLNISRRRVDRSSIDSRQISGVQYPNILVVNIEPLPVLLKLNYIMPIGDPGSYVDNNRR